MNMILRILPVLLLTGVASFGQSNGPEIFLKSIPSGFETVDMDHDQDGNTYVLGRRGGAGLIVKYDSAGSTVQSQDIVIPNFQPVAFDVVGGTAGGSIYVASSSVVQKYSLTGTLLSSVAVMSGVTDVVFAPATGKLLVGIQSPGYPPIVQVRSSNNAFEKWMVFGEVGWTNSSLRRRLSMP